MVRRVGEEVGGRRIRAPVGGRGLLVVVEVVVEHGLLGVVVVGRGVGLFVVAGVVVGRIGLVAGEGVERVGLVGVEGVVGQSGLVGVEEVVG